MPRPIVFWTSFTAGEVSPSVWYRPDLQKYNSACQVVLNYHLIPQGGATRRPGLRKVAEVKTSTCTTIVRPFIFSPTQAYIIELGCTYARFYRSSAQLTTSNVPVEVTTPYDGTKLHDLDFVQSADVLYTLSCDYAARKFERYSDTCWRFRQVSFQPPPTIEYGARPPGTLQVSAISGDNITVTSLIENSFEASDVGREILVTAGENAGARMGIKSYTSQRVVVGTICEPFLNTTVTCTTLWKIGGSPRTKVTPSAKSPVGLAVTLTLTTAGWRGWEDLDTEQPSPTDCGKYAIINGGMVEITGLQSATVANGVLRSELSSTTAAEAGAWTLEESLFSSNHTFPETGDFFDDRLYLNAAHRLCGSKTSDYENFAIGTLDDDGVIFPINSKTISTIRGIVGARELQIFTAGGEFKAVGGGSTGESITPSNIQISSETSYGSRGVAPVRIGDVTVFVTRGGRQLREFTIRSDSVSDAYVAPDLLLLAEHLTESHAITDVAYQREPRSTLWAVRADGVLLSCAYRREENVVAWSRHVTCGWFESVAVIPHPDGDRDQVWVTVKRTINGATKRFVEFFDDCDFYYSQLHTDCALRCSPGGTITSVGDLNYLAGQGVKVVVDGLEYADQTVPANGILTISPGGTKVEVGLPYISELTPLRPEVAIGGQTSQFSKMRWVELSVKVLRSMGMTVRTDATSAHQIDFDSSCSVGEIRLTRLGWDCSVVTIQQRKPLPSTVLAIGGVLDLGGT